MIWSYTSKVRLRIVWRYQKGHQRP